jgi:hypothetical protein
MEFKGWRLVRAALVKIADESSPQVSNLRLDSTEVVRTRNVRMKDKPVGTIYVASIPVELVPRSDIAELLSGQVRLEAEAALEFLARFAAIEISSTYELSSPYPFVGLACRNVDDLAELDGRPVALRSIVMRIRGENASMNIPDALGTSLHADRREGVALLAEALNSRSPLGRYSQLMRVFERAFRLGPKDLTEPLASFLAGTNHSFEAEEVKQWTDARAFVIHADRRPQVYLDADVRPFEARMLEAAYDVLLNKAKWQSKSSERRNIWLAPSGSKGANNERMYIQQGQKVILNADKFDGFMAYPLIAENVPFAQALPRAAWLVGSSDGGKLEVLGDWEAEACAAEDIQEIIREQ